MEEVMKKVSRTTAALRLDTRVQAPTNAAANAPVQNWFAQQGYILKPSDYHTE